MTGARGVYRAGPAVPSQERDLIVRLLTTLLREDVAGIRTQGRLITQAGATWLVRRRLWIPVRPANPDRGDWLCDVAVRAPFVRYRTPGRRVDARRLFAVLRLLGEELLLGLARDQANELQIGFRALQREALAALLGAGHRRRARPRTFGRLRPELVGRAGLGWLGAIGFETLAAHRDHPLYPFSLARVDLPVADLRAVAPEYRPDLELRWLCLPTESVELAGQLPDWWPVTEGVALPVHPAVPAATLREALGDRGLQAEALASPPEIFRPTLSLRTLVAVRHPAVHLKLPLAVRTLGRLNLRTIARPGLADGALVGKLLQQVLRREPEFAEVVQSADESSWVSAGHPLLAVLIRRWENDLVVAEAARNRDAVIVPVAGLAGGGPDGRPVMVTLASRFVDGDLDHLIEQYLRLLIGWHVRLWLRHGLVLEAHPQNVLVAVDRTAGGPRIRLLLRDLDSAKVDFDVLAGSLGPEAPVRAELSDDRLAVSEPGELVNLFITTTLHQCVAAVLIDLAAALRRPARPWLDLVRPLLVAAAARDPDARDASRFQAAIVDGSRLPVKRALTAATLLPKTRTGAADVNKYYGADAPSYL